MFCKSQILFSLTLVGKLVCAEFDEDLYPHSFWDNSSFKSAKEKDGSIFISAPVRIIDHKLGLLSKLHRNPGRERLLPRLVPKQVSGYPGNPVVCYYCNVFFGTGGYYPSHSSKDPPSEDFSGSTCGRQGAECAKPNKAKCCAGFSCTYLLVGSFCKCAELGLPCGDIPCCQGYVCTGSQPDQGIDGTCRVRIDGKVLVDKVLSHVRRAVIAKGLDNIHMPDITVKLFNERASITHQSAKGLANVYRVGDVDVRVGLIDTRFRSAFAMYNVSTDSDVKIHTNSVNYRNGHVHGDCDNVTAHQVYVLSHITQTVTLDEFDLTVGHCEFHVTGLGEDASSGSAMITEIFAQIKDPLALIFSASLQLLINAGLIAARAILVG